MSNFLKLSFDCDPKGPYPPGIPTPIIGIFTSLDAGDIANQYVITLCNHTGTHVDAPAHVVKGGAGICDFDISEFVYESTFCLFLDLNDTELIYSKHIEKYDKAISKSDLLLMITGYDKYRETEPDRYRIKGPGFSVEVAKYIINKFPNLKALGLDTISLAAIEHLEEGMKAHKILLGGAGKHFLIYEAMNLEHVKKNLKQVIAMPFFIKGFDGAPCTIIGITK